MISDLDKISNGEPQLRPVSARFLSKGRWDFFNPYGRISDRVQLLLDGTILGHSNENEARWEYCDGNILFISIAGRVTSILSPTKDDDPHYIEFSGPFLLEPTSDRHHILRKRRPKIGCFLRTHFWNKDVELAYKALEKSWGAAPWVSADQTHHFDIPNSIQTIPHSLEEFRALELPDFPNPNQTMWYNGDYVFYITAMKSDFDYFIFCEFDLYVNTDLRNLVANIINDGVDFVAPNVMTAEESWQWARVQSEWDRLENSEHTRPEKREVLKSFFPFIVVSRTASLQLFARRIQCSLAVIQNKITTWPFCESFVPTEMSRQGFVCRPLSDYIHQGHMTISDVRTWSEAFQSETAFVHPVLGESRFVAKAFEHYSLLDKTSREQATEWLSQQVMRRMSNTEMSMLMERIRSMQQP